MSAKENHGGGEEFDEEEQRPPLVVAPPPPTAVTIDEIKELLREEQAQMREEMQETINEAVTRRVNEINTGQSSAGEDNEDGWEVREGFIIADPSRGIIVDDDRPPERKLERDIFSVMMVSRSFPGWFVGIATYIFQFGLSLLVTIEAITRTTCGSIPCGSVLGAPLRVPIEVTIVRWVAAFVIICAQTDLATSIQTAALLRYDGDAPWDIILFGRPGLRTRCMHLSHVIFPNVLKFLQGLMVLYATLYAVIIKSTTIIDFMRDFAVLLIISQVDNIIFQIAKMGYLGNTLKANAEWTTAVAWRRNCHSKDEVAMNEKKRMRKRVFLFFLLIGFQFVIALTWMVIDEYSGLQVRNVYPDCYVDSPRLIGNGICNDFAPYNTTECGFDGGDCY